MGKGIVYALENENGTYIGSTFDYDQRMNQHNRNTKGKSYMITKNLFTSRILLEIEIDKKGLRKLEGEFQLKMKCINVVIAGRTDKERNEQQRLLFLPFKAEFDKKSKAEYALRIAEKSRLYQEQKAKRITEQPSPTFTKKTLSELRLESWRWNREQKAKKLQNSWNGCLKPEKIET